MEGTKIIKCTCPHCYQDSIHGVQMRVHNISPKGEAKCTVCGMVKKVSAPVTLSADKKVKAAKS